MPFPFFVNAGSLATNITNQTLAVVSGAYQTNDILIVQVINKALTLAISAPDSTWTEIYQADGDCTTAADDHRAAIFWKRATTDGTGTTFNFTKPSGTVLFAGVCSVWRGCNPFMPLDTTARGATVTAAASDNVSFPAFDPTGSECHIIFMAFYGNDLTTFGAAMSNDVNPDCTTRYDLETSSGNDCTLACTSGNNDGSNIASRTWASASTTDAGSTGVVFGLVAKPALPNNYQFVRVGDGMSCTEKIR
jgi:hypothetical protein